MATIALPLPESTVSVRDVPVVISTSGGASVRVTGYDGGPAGGRTVLVLGRTVWGQWAVKGSAITDNDGEFSISVNAGPSEPLVAVCIGDPDHGEHTRALGNLTAA